VKKLKITALILSVTIVFSMFTGISFAESVDTGDQVIVIKDGEVISGNTDLIEQGIIILGSPDSIEGELVDEEQDVESALAPVIDIEGEIDASDVKENFDRVPVKDEEEAISKPSTGSLGSAQGTGTMPVTPPKETVSAVSPNAPQLNVTPSTIVNYIDGSSNVTVAGAIASWSYSSTYAVNDNARSWLDLAGQDKTHTLAQFNSVGYYVVEGGNGYVGDNVCGYVHPKYKTTTVTTPVLHNSYYCITVGGKTGAGVAKAQTLTLKGATDTSVIETGLQRHRSTSAPSGSEKYPMILVESNGTLNIEGIAAMPFILDGNAGTGATGANTATQPVLVVRGTATLKNVWIRENYLSTGNGAGIYVDGGTLTLENVIIGACEAKAGNGGGIYVNSGTVTIKGSNSEIGAGSRRNYIANTSGITNYSYPNKANYGAGIYVNGGTLNIQGGNVRYNTANNNGGGIYVNTNGSLNISGGCSISSNVCDGASGAGVFVADGNKGTISVKGTSSSKVKISSNQNKGGNGGGVWLGSSTDTLIEFEHFEINSNIASGGGAGMMLNRTNKISLKNGTINSNTASDKGGAIWLGNNGLASTSPMELTVENVVMNGNTAKTNGGGMYINGGYCHIKSGEISNNTLSAAGNSYGGAICAQMNGSSYSTTLILGVEGSTTNTPIISNNGGANDGCAWDGGGVYVNNSNLIIHNCRIDANKGKHGGGVYFYQTVSGKEFVMHDGVISNNYYCGVFINGSQYNATTMIMNGGTITKNQIKADSANHQFGGAGVNLYNASMEMNGGTISENKNLLDRVTDTSERGNTAMTGGGVGAIRTATTNVSTFKMTGGKIIDNTSVGEGAGVYIEQGCKVGISGGEISGNKVTSSGKPAGGLNLYKVKGLDGDTVYVSNVKFEGNISSLRGGAINCYDTPLVLTSCEFIGNKMENYVAGENGCGGAMYFICSGGTAESPALSVQNCSFTGNEAKEWGGGLYITGNNYTSISDTTFDGNDAAGFGGGIGVHNGVTLSVSNSVFGNNTAKEGAGIAIIEPETTSNKVSTGIVNNCTVGIIDGKAAPNTASTCGGGLYLGSGALTVTDTVVSNNITTDGNGGGIYVWKGVLKVYAENRDVQINENTCKTSGAGVCISGSVNAGDTFEFVGKNNYKVNIDGNVNKEDNGGGIWVGPVKSLLMENFTVNGNFAIADASGNQAGGGVFLNRASNDIVLKNGTVNNNQAKTKGGGVYIADNGGNEASLTVSITNVEICDNKVVGEYSPEANLLANVNGSGGGVFVLSTNADAVKLTMTDCVIDRNECTAYGGGVFAYQSKIDILSTEVDKNSVSDNTTAVRGGGLYLYKCTGVSANAVSISNITINGNTASGEAGGGACIDSTNVNFTGYNHINDNHGAMYGGGMVVRADDTSKTWTVNVNTQGEDGGTTSIDGNYVYNFDGGGVHVGGKCILNMKGGTISSNVNSRQRGGGIDVQGTAELEDTVINGNTANTSGGGVSVRKGGKLNLKNVTVSDNTASGNTTSTRNGGGGIYVEDTANVKLEGISVYNNSSTNGNGGGICIIEVGNTADTAIIIDDAEIYGNSAVKDAPYDGAFKYKSVSTVGNGGGIYVYGKNTHVSLSDSTVGKENQPNQAVYGAGVAVTWGASFTATNVQNNHNKAFKAGGGYYLFSFADYVTDPESYSTALNVDGGTINGNMASLRKNHDISASGASLDTLKFDDNGTEKDISTEIGGGAVFIRSYSNYKQAKAEIINATIEDNYSYHSAGAIFVHEGADLTVSNCDFINNQGRQFSGAIHFLRSGSAVSVSDCTFDGNNAGIRGGCMYINASGVNISDSVMKNNFVSQLWSGHALGGAIYVTSSTDATSSDVQLLLKSVDFIGNYVVGNGNAGASHGGAVFAESDARNVNVTLSKSDKGDVCKLIGNYATGNGGAIAVSSKKTTAKATVTMNGGYVIGNHAGNVATNVTESPYQKAYTATAGAGGGVAVFGGSFALNITDANKGAIYGNLAATAGDDVFANGNTASSVTVPSVSKMTLYSGELPEGLPAELPTSLTDRNWYEDYMTDDTNYTKGLNGNSSFIFRYRTTPLSIPAAVSDISSNSYVSITVGTERNHTGMITITTPVTSDPNQRFVYMITAKPLEGDTTTFTVSLAGGETVVIKHLSAGTYTVKQETSWAWRYSFNGVSQEGGTNQVIDGDSITFYLACSVPEDTVSVSYTNSLTNNQWLDYNSPIKTNVPTTNVAYRIDMALNDKKCVLV